MSVRTYLSSPVAWTCLSLLVLGTAIALYGWLHDRAERRRTILQKLTQKGDGRTGLDNLLDRIRWVVQSEEAIQADLDVLGSTRAARQVTKLRLLCGLGGIFIGILFRNWLLGLLMVPVFMQGPLFWIEYHVRRRLRQFEEQVQNAFQMFLTEYTTTHSVPRSLHGILLRVQPPLNRELERLVTKLDSGVQPQDAFLDFARRTRSRWTFIFAQLMMAYFQHGGDFTDALQRIIQDMAGERILEQQNRTELALLRLVHIILVLTVPVMLVAMLLTNPQDARVFVDNPSGRRIIVTVTVGLLVSIYFGRKLTESV